MKSIEAYRKVVPDEMLAEIYRKAKKLYTKHILHINSTFQGGGVAEMLSSLIPLMNSVGIETGWRVLHGSPDFFTITKKFHNALHGGALRLTSIKKDIYTKTNYNFSTFTHIDHDCVIVHDPQPLPLINFYRKHQPWIWRCHVDLSHPNKELWEYFKEFIIKYDLVIISHDNYRKKDLPVEQRVIYPAIDPLSPKNMDIKEETIKRFVKKFDIPTNKPIITQISRFDKWKDPEGVIDVFERICEEEKVDCRLILCGSMAMDDPEGWNIYRRVEKKANKLKRKIKDRKGIILITVENDILVNVLQRISTVVIQKSVREGFGLTVSEALWKGTPVIASNVGGISLQIKNGENGYLLNPNDIDGFAKRVIELIGDEEKRKEMGKKGKEYVRKNFLITRLLHDYIDILTYILE